MASPGDLVGPYRLVSPLGKGAMGEVWRAHDERLDRHVALKVLPPEAAGDLERRARQLREAKAAAAIRHPSVVTLYDIVSHETEDILVMEIVEGRTLSDALRKDGPPPLERALRWIASVADALAAAHAKGILHRDIKAANIMVTSSDEIKVLDFGLAKLRDDAPHASASQSFPRAAADAIERKIALDETMPSEGGPSLRSSRPSFELDSYKTHAGQLLGTPIYMAPEQIAGEPPDERTEVFSIGVLAYEILSGKPPYTATSLETLFVQITKETPKPITGVPDPVFDIVARAMAKDPAQRIPNMAALRDAVTAEHKRRFAPRAKRWPLIAALALAVVGASVAVYAVTSSRTTPKKPGDERVDRALVEYDAFYNDKALSSLRSALAIAPDHPRANAYIILFGGASDADQAKAVAVAQRTLPSLPAASRDRALLVAASTLVEKGPAAAREALVSSPAMGKDRELAFWAAELDYRAGNYAAASDAYRALLDNDARTLRGRIYDHYSSVLLYAGKAEEALRIGTLYRDAFPDEADAIGVYATTLAAVGQYDEAVAAAEQALALAEGEDTLAGLAKVLTLRNKGDDRKRAADLYRQSIDRAGPSRRPVRRAALALVQLMAGDATAAASTVAPCLPESNMPEATARERGACLFVAALVEPARAAVIASELEALQAAATPAKPAYGAPASLAALVRARAVFFGGGCILPPESPATPPPASLATAYESPLDFYAAYHVPLFNKYAQCEKASLAKATLR